EHYAARHPCVHDARSRQSGRRSRRDPRPRRRCFATTDRRTSAARPHRRGARQRRARHDHWERRALPCLSERLKNGIPGTPGVDAPMTWWLRVYLLFAAAQGMGIGLTGLFVPDAMQIPIRNISPLNHQFVAALYVGGGIGVILAAFTRWRSIR